MRARLILGFLFFVICLGLGYAGLNRYDPRQVDGLRDTRRYVAMLNGTANWKTQQELRVLVPFLARPIYRAAVGKVGTWQPEFVALLIVNSVFVAWAAVLLVSIGERVTASYLTGLTASLLYLLSFNVVNVQLAGLVDSAEAWAMIALTWALLSQRWAMIPLIGIVGALGKETSIPLMFVFSASWCVRLAVSKTAPRNLYLATAALLVFQIATVTITRIVLTGESLLPWQLVTDPRRLGITDALGATLFNREMLYAFGWLLPLGVMRLRRLPAEWVIASTASLLAALAIGIWFGVTGNASRPAFNAVGALLVLSVAILLSELRFMKEPTTKTMKIAALVVAHSYFFAPATVSAQTAGPAQLVSVPISDIRYDVTYDSATALRRTFVVTMSFSVRAAGDVLLSLPAWTPGAYSLANFARYVTDFSATDGSAAVSWDKTDHDTWRIHVPRAGQVRVSFEYLGMTLDNANSWTRPEFAFFNGTNLFLYPEGQPAEFSSTVIIHTNPSWRIATGMTQTGPTTFTASNYHDLVDMPFFIGRFDIDSAQAGGKTMRFASYPAGAVSNSGKRMVLDQLAKLVPPQAAVFGEIPWTTYTLLQVADSGYTPGSASGLEHQNSHLDILSNIVLGNPVLASLYAHEIFHAWNVKRMRPAELWPYRYDRQQPSPLLWISEGITDYYADVSEVRGGVINAEQFYAITTAKVDEVAEAAAVALEDASLSAWVHPVDGTNDIYYSKGSLAGLLLDILIRDASDNQRSLDTVMRELYRSSYKRGRGFTNEDWWQAVARAAGRSFADFERRYVDGRDAYPWDSVLPLAGMRLMIERTVLPNLGASISADEQGRRVIAVDPGGTGAAAGLKVGDYLVSIGGVDVADPAFGTTFSSKFAGVPPGGTIPVGIRRGTQQLTLSASSNFRTIERRRIIAVSNASPKAARIREGILTGKPAT